MHASCLSTSFHQRYSVLQHSDMVRINYSDGLVSENATIWRIIFLDLVVQSFVDFFSLGKIVI